MASALLQVIMLSIGFSPTRTTTCAYAAELNFLDGPCKLVAS